MYFERLKRLRLSQKVEECKPLPQMREAGSLEALRHVRAQADAAAHQGRTLVHFSSVHFVGYTRPLSSST